MQQKLILASGSAARRRLLCDAGIDVVSSPVDLDENEIRIAGRKNGATAQSIALKLAHEKAAAHAVQFPDQKMHYVIAADQILSCEGRQIDKSTSLRELLEVLKFLRGRTHQLHTATVLYHNETALWTHLETPTLTMRAYSDAFLNDYLSREGCSLLSSVGGYFFEGRGAQLFSNVDGQSDAIRGLPLIPLLGALRMHGVISS